MTTQEVTFERATWRDVMALWRLHRACFGADAYDPLTLLLLVIWPGNAAIKAMAGQELVGFVAGDWPLGDRHGWIVTLGVLPGFRQHGIGTRLLAGCEARLTPQVLRLYVRQSNAAAIALYEKFGYVQVRRQPRYYGDGEVGLLMEKTRQSVGNNER